MFCCNCVNLLNETKIKISILFYFCVSFCRAILCKRGLCRRAVVIAVCPSVKFANSVKTSNRIFKFFSPSGSQTIRDFRTKRHCNILTGTGLRGGGVECKWGRHKSRFSTNIWLSDRRLLQCKQHVQPSTVSAVYRTDSHASVNLCLSQPAWTTTTKKREENKIYLYAAVNLKRKQLITEDCVRRSVLLKTDRREAPRGLSATAELFVSYCSFADVFMTRELY